MHIPFCMWAKDIPGIGDKQLDADNECICGKMVPLRGCIAMWSHRVGDEDYKWFQVCDPACILLHISIGGEN